MRGKNIYTLRNTWEIVHEIVAAHLEGFNGCGRSQYLADAVFDTKIVLPESCVSHTTPQVFRWKVRLHISLNV